MRENRISRIESNEWTMPGEGNRAQNSQICPRRCHFGDSRQSQRETASRVLSAPCPSRRRIGGAPKDVLFHKMDLFGSNAIRLEILPQLVLLYQVVNHICRCMLVRPSPDAFKISIRALPHETDKPTVVRVRKWPMANVMAKASQTYAQCIHVSYRRCSWL